MICPLVSVCCICYNQERFIRDALKGFVSQETSFPFEIVISDDCSNDSTRTIIQEFKDEFPSLFRDISPSTNLGSMTNFIRVQEEAKGRYIALCEGDDYWTDNHKLQKQVDFLEQNPDYALCFTNCIVSDNGKESIGNSFVWDTYSTKDLILHNSLDVKKREDSIIPPGHTSTVVYRKPQNGLPNWISKCFIGDEPLFISLSKYGKAKFINETMSVYRKGIGISSQGFSFELDFFNRIKMYRVIDSGFNKQYHRLISQKVISRYYKRLTRLAYHRKEYFKCFQYFVGYLCYFFIL